MALDASDRPRPAENVRSYLLAGAALYEAGRYHAAHDPWESAWLAVRASAPADGALLQGLIQTTAAIYHATQENEPGAVGLAASAQSYLEAVPAGHRSVELAPVVRFLPRLERSLAAAATPPPLRVGGEQVTLADLELPAAGAASQPLANALGYEPALFDRALAYAWADLEEAPTSAFANEILAFVADRGAPRSVIAGRLRRRVDRRAARDADVAELFDPE